MNPSGSGSEAGEDAGVARAGAIVRSAATDRLGLGAAAVEASAGSAGAPPAVLQPAAAVIAPRRIAIRSLRILVPPSDLPFTGDGTGRPCRVQRRAGRRLLRGGRRGRRGSTTRARAGQDEVVALAATRMLQERQRVAAELDRVDAGDAIAEP